MASTSAGSPSPEPSTAIKHGPNCDLHGPPLSSQCNAMTVRKLPCRRAPNRLLFSPDRLPVCNQHKYRQASTSREISGNRRVWPTSQSSCRVRSAFPLLRRTRKRHRHTTVPPATLSAVLRDATWQCVLPGIVFAYRYGHVRNTFALLRVNQQTSNEASSVMYGQVPFDVDVTGDSILFVEIIFSPLPRRIRESSTMVACSR
jgi:hypothetical protein